MVGWVSDKNKVKIRKRINNRVGIKMKIQRTEVDWGYDEVRGKER